MAVRASIGTSGNSSLFRQFASTGFRDENDSKNGRLLEFDVGNR